MVKGFFLFFFFKLFSIIFLVVGTHAKINFLDKNSNFVFSVTEGQVHVERSL